MKCEDLGGDVIQEICILVSSLSRISITSLSSPTSRILEATRPAQRSHNGSYEANAYD